MTINDIVAAAGGIIEVPPRTRRQAGYVSNTLLVVLLILAIIAVLIWILTHLSVAPHS